MFCWMDEWYGLTMPEIREFEAQVQHELNEVLFRINFNLFFRYEKMVQFGE